MMKEMSIRPAVMDDAVLLSVLAATTFYEAYFEQDEPDNLARYVNESFAVEKVRAEIAEPGSMFFIVFVDGKAVGYARLIENSRLDCVEGGRVIELKRLYILERVRGTGIGRRLMEYCLDEARRRSFDVLWLGVWEKNVRAHEFYAKFGFAEAGTVTFPYGDVEGTNLVLQLSLDD
jgi:diamine N-acetyltransferase